MTERDGVGIEVIIVLLVLGAGIGAVLLVALVVLSLGASGPPIAAASVGARAVDIDPVRAAAGLGAAVALLGVAGLLVRTTDWSPPEG